MSTESNEYTLGENVTRYALSKGVRDTVVVSVRLSVEDFTRLERICVQTGMSMSQVVRNAVAAYSGPEEPLDQSFKVNMQTSEGVTLAFGPVDYSQAPSTPRTFEIHGENQVTGRV